MLRVGIGDDNRCSRSWLCIIASALILATVTSAPPAVADEALDRAVRENAHAMSLNAEGRLVGPGAELLVREGRRARYFLVGEEHGVAEIPLVSAALFRELVPAGYRHVAIETGFPIAAALNRVAAEDGLHGIEAFVERYYPGSPFYNMREEAGFIANVVDAAGGGRDVLWGLDYEVMGDRYPLRRLRDLAPDEAARAAADRAIAYADSMFDTALAASNPATVFTFAGDPMVLARVRTAYDPAAGSEADRILSLLEETLAINAMFMSGQGWESNARRAGHTKHQFMHRLHEALAAGHAPPKVFFKFGATHTLRGRTFTNVFDLGSLTHELASADGAVSFGVMMVGDKDADHGSFDPETFGTRPMPSDFATPGWAEPFFDTTGWTVYDLRPIRRLHATRKLTDLSGSMLKVLYGADAFVVLMGSRASEALVNR